MSFSNVSQKLQITSPIVQKDIYRVIIVKTSKAIIMDMGDFYFVALIDEARDIAT